jgi:rubrerythrin
MVVGDGRRFKDSSSGEDVEEGNYAELKDKMDRKERRRAMLKKNAAESDKEWEKVPMDVDDEVASTASGSTAAPPSSASAVAPPSTSAPSAASDTGDIADMSTVEKSARKAAKKARQRSKKGGLAAVPEGDSTGTDEEREAKAEVMQMMKLRLQMEVAAQIKPKQTFVDGAASVADYKPAPPPPPAWTPEEERYIRERAQRELQKASGSAAAASECPSPEAPTAPAAKPDWRCHICGVLCIGFQYFKLLSSDSSYLDVNWCNSIIGVCQPCSGEDARSFKKAARASHMARLEAVKARAARVRDIVFNSSKSAIQVQFPHISNTQLRKLAVERVSMMVVALGANFMRAAQAAKDAMAKISEDYLLDVQHAAAEPGTAKRVSEGPKIGFTATTWLTQVADDLWVSWVCRSCRWFGLNHQWIRHADKEWYRCPHCGVRYQPWAWRPDWHDSQKAVTVQNPISGDAVSFGASWPNGEEDNWLARMVEVKAKTQSLPDGVNLSDYLCSTAVSLDELLTKVAVPASFRTFAWKSDVESKLDVRTYPERNWAHLRQGYTGDILTEEGAQNPFKEWEQLISLFAQSVVGAARLGMGSR